MSSFRWQSAKATHTRNAWNSNAKIIHFSYKFLTNKFTIMNQFAALLIVNFYVSFFWHKQVKEERGRGERNLQQKHFFEDTFRRCDKKKKGQIFFAWKKKHREGKTFPVSLFTLVRSLVIISQCVWRWQNLCLQRIFFSLLLWEKVFFCGGGKFSQI